jgi:hypothetical protein
MLYHVLIDGGAALNLISLATFQKLQIPMSKLAPSHPFLGVGSESIIPRGCISLPVTFGTPENYRTESVIFYVTEVNLPFNAILSRSALYKFMIVAHYGYLVLKMLLPDGTSFAALGQRGHSREGRLDRHGCRPGHLHHEEPG